MSSQLATGTVHLVSPLGGPVRRLSDFPVHGRLSWSPDGRWLAVAEAARSERPGASTCVSATSGEWRPLTRADPPAFDLSPAFDPDGSAIAYAACNGPEASPNCNIHVVAARRRAGARRPGPRARSAGPGRAEGCAGRCARAFSSVYSANASLWRVRADGTAARRAAGAGRRGRRAGHGRLPRSPGLREADGRCRDVYRFEPGRAPRPLVHSTLLERQPSYSPNGRRIAFQVGQARGDHIWLADADGSSPTRLTRGPEPLRAPRPGPRTAARSRSTHAVRTHSETSGRSARTARGCTASRSRPPTTSGRRGRATVRSSTSRPTERDARSRFRVAVGGGPGNS